ncbi:MAG: NAD(P)/FAD-dependent oxidoreductase [Acidobacteriota bacterium]
MCDVAVVGGGPGGLYAARQLAQRGFEVAVFEEHASPGEPVHCTGVLAVEAFDEFDVPRESILNPLATATFFGPSGASFAYTTPHTEAVVIDRASFDRVLSERAEAVGVRVHADVRVMDVQVSDRSVRVVPASGPPVEARACILACGANYTLQRRLGLGMASLHLQSAQVELPADRPGDTEVHFGSEVAPKGFAWAVPVHRAGRAFARVGLMCERDARDYFDRFLAAIAPRWQIGTEQYGRGSVEPRSKVLPLGPIARTYAARLLAVGDAAGLVKATTGGGIYYSLLSGELAADVLARALHLDELDEASLAPYEERWRALLGDELSAQATLREIANDLSDAEIDSLFELARTNGIMPIIRRTATFNRHRNLIVSLLGHPPARRLLMRRMLGWSA